MITKHTNTPRETTAYLCDESQPLLESLYPLILAARVTLNRIKYIVHRVHCVTKYSIHTCSLASFLLASSSEAVASTASILARFKLMERKERHIKFRKLKMRSVADSVTSIVLSLPTPIQSIKASHLTSSTYIHVPAYQFSLLGC